MKKRIIALTLFSCMLALTLFGCGSNKASSTSANNTPAKKSTLVVGLDDQFPPMGFRDAQGNITGFDIDLATEAAKRLGMQIKFQPIDWKVKEQELNSGNIDCIWNGMTITPEIKDAMTVSQPYMKNEQIIVVKKDSPIASQADLAGKKLGLQAGSSANNALDANTSFKSTLGKVLPYDDNSKALMDLDAGGIDAVLMDSVVALYYVQKDGKYKVLSGSLADEEYGVGFRKADTELCSKVEGALKQMATDGKMAEISNKWFGKDVTIIK
ncbi:MAG: amino acid ABC transporter substrate-binding protein [Bacillota bacterium]|nr:amino acid ABC transporter substrate-binding protein [Bacillota bacterium]